MAIETQLKLDRDAVMEAIAQYIARTMPPGVVISTNTLLWGIPAYSPEQSPTQTYLQTGWKSHPALAVRMQREGSPIKKEDMLLKDVGAIVTVNVIGSTPTTPSPEEIP